MGITVGNHSGTIPTARQRQNKFLRMKTHIHKQQKRGEKLDFLMWMWFASVLELEQALFML